MVKLLTRDYLSRRFFVAVATFAVSLLLIAAICVQALISYQTNARLSALFSELFEVTARLEGELAWSLAQRATPERNSTLAARYRDALAAFSALRATDADRHDTTEVRWQVLETEYGIDPDAERTRFGLGQGTMPAALHEVWHLTGGGTGQLGEAVAEFLNLAQWIVEKRAAGVAPDMRVVENLRNLSQTRLFPAFHSAAKVIAESTSRSASFFFHLLIACAVAGLVGAALAAIFLFRPLQGEVLENQDLLVRERDRARAAEQGNRDFLAMMSHELRTPMNGVIGFTDLLLASPLTPQQKEHAETIKESGKALLELLNGILELSRIEAGALDIEEGDLSFSEIIEDIVTLLGPQAVAKRLDLAAFVDPALPERLRGDAGRLRQILVNLVGNAIKFTPSGGVAIEVRHEGGTDADGHAVHIAVTDTGIGIDKDQIERIFQRFTQVDSSPTRRYEGSGLGLSISRELARAMGGQLTVESTPDKGSIFSLRLVLASAQPPAAKISDRARISFAGARFLVVDDNALNRRIFRLQLEGYGAEVETVPDGHAALAALRKAESHGKRYDLAVIDQMMPDIDGITLRRMIREEPRYAGMKLIISSSGGIGYDQQARALGFHAACPKPIIQERLIAKIAELITPESAAASAAPPVALLAPRPAGPVAPRAEGGPLRLLVAEDNPINQRLLVTALKHAGFSVDVVDDGTEAVRAVERQPFDLVLMDIRMPVMNGVEATQRIRALPTAVAKIPIIAMTANAMAGDREEYLAAGMDDYVAKPIDFNILLTKIRAHLPIALTETMASTAETAAWPEKQHG